MALGTIVVAGQSNALRIWDSNPEPPAGYALRNVSFGGTSLTVHWQPGYQFRLRESLIAAVAKSVGPVIILWNQGEADTDLTNYYADFSQLKSDVEAGRTDVLWIIHFRSPNATGTGGITTMRGIQQDICDHLARCIKQDTTGYVFESDNVHYTADTQRRAWRDSMLLAQSYYDTTFYRSVKTYADQTTRDDQQAAIFEKYRDDAIAARGTTDLDTVRLGGYAAPQITDRFGAGSGLSLVVDETMIAMHGSVVNIGAHGDITIDTRTPMVTDPDTIFAASKLVDWWEGAYGVALVSTEVDKWWGQKLNAGIPLAAPAASNRCTQTATNAAFNNRATVNSDYSGSNYLKATPATPPILATDKPCVLMVCRASATWAAAHLDTFFALGDSGSPYRVWMGLGGSPGNWRSFLDGSSQLNVSASETVAAFVRFQRQSGAGGFVLQVGASTASGTGSALSADVTDLSFGATRSGGDGAKCEAALIILLRDIPSAGELSAIAAYATERYAV
jgi:hypothetical protein